MRVGPVGGAALVQPGFVVGSTREAGGAVLTGHQPVAHVGVEGIGAGDVERRLRRGVVEGRLARGDDGRRRRAPSASVLLPWPAGIAPTGGTIGSYSQSPAKVPGRACLASSRAAPPIEWPTPRSLAGRERRGRPPRSAGRRASPPTGGGCPGGPPRRRAPGSRSPSARSRRRARPTSAPTPRRGTRWHGRTRWVGHRRRARARPARRRRGWSPSASLHPRRAAPCEANSVGAMPDPAADEETAG